MLLRKINKYTKDSYINIAILNDKLLGVKRIEEMDVKNTNHN